MSEFYIYLTLGAEHITDPNGYDHILFIVALAAIYRLKHWKQVAWLVTSFTVGHSITLALSTLKIVMFSSAWIEFLIPLTIFLTCWVNFHHREDNRKASSFFTNRYFVAIFFGLIHGLGFSNYLRELLGSQSDIVVPLLSFNLGLELGQLLIVFIALLVTALFVSIFNVKKREWMLLLSGAAGGVSFLMMLERIPF